MTPRELAEHEGKPIALAWIASAEAALLVPGDALTLASLAANFAWPRLAPDEQRRFVEGIAATYGLVRSVLERSAARFADVSERGARALFVGDGDIPPAYAIYGDRVYFTPRFARYDPAAKRGFGPKCRAAMVLHESVHLCDPRSGEASLHISEWDEPRFSGLAPEEAVHNPSAYASFAAQVHHRQLEWPVEARFGAGNRGL